MRGAGRNQRCGIHQITRRHRPIVGTQFRYGGCRCGEGHGGARRDKSGRSRRNGEPCCITAENGGRNRRPKVQSGRRWYRCMVGAQVGYGMRRCGGQNLGSAHREDDSNGQCKRTFATLMHTPPLSFFVLAIWPSGATDRSRQSAFKNQSPLNQVLEMESRIRRPGRPAAPPMSKAVTVRTKLAT